MTVRVPRARGQRSARNQGWSLRVRGLVRVVGRVLRALQARASVRVLAVPVLVVRVLGVSVVPTVPGIRPLE